MGDTWSATGISIRLPRKIELTFGDSAVAATATLGSPGHAEVRLAGRDRPSRYRSTRRGWRAGPDTSRYFPRPAPSPSSCPTRSSASAEAAASADAIRAPMPGLVKLVRVAKGDAVVKGQPLLVLEAMKMEHAIAAPHDAVIAEIVAEGRQVTDGDVLVRFEPAAAKADSGPQRSS